MKKITFLFAPSGNGKPDIYFVCNSEGHPIGKQFKAEKLDSVKSQFETKGYIVKIDNNG